MGLYYSGGYDWPYNDAVLSSMIDSVLAVPKGDAYREYATAHVRELIDRYQPSVLWNDICWPSGGNLAELFAYFYNAERGRDRQRPLGGVDPTSQHRLRTDVEGLRRGRAAALALHPGGAQGADLSVGEPLRLQDSRICAVRPHQEAQVGIDRGVGHSFGANRDERPEDIVTATELIRSFADIVSKNGNLLIGIGPDPDGSIPEMQQTPLNGLGAWLAVHGEAIYGTRPWETPEGRTSEGTPLRFTRHDDAVYAILVETPGTLRFAFRDIDVSGLKDVRLLDVDDPIEWSVVDDRLNITLPERLPVSPAHTIRLAPADGVTRSRDPARRGRSRDDLAMIAALVALLSLLAVTGAGMLHRSSHGQRHATVVLFTVVAVLAVTCTIAAATSSSPTAMPLTHRGDLMADSPRFRRLDDEPWQEVRRQQHGDRVVSVREKWLDSAIGTFRSTPSGSPA